MSSKMNDPIEKSRIKLKENYAKFQMNKRRIIVITKHVPHEMINSKNKVKDKIISVKKEKEETEVMICKAITMNGKSCECKVKTNGLCGRHLKKSI